MPPHWREFVTALGLASASMPAAGQSPGPMRRAEEIARFPSSDAAYQVSSIGGAERTPRGETILLAPMDQVALVFDKGGRYLRSIGRRGQGPGEFAVAGPLGMVGDTLWIGDPVLRRITLFTADGKLLRTISVPLEGEAWLLPGGDVLVVPAANLDAANGAGHRLSIERVAGRAQARTVVLTAAAPYRVLELDLGGSRIAGRQ